MEDVVNLDDLGLARHLSGMVDRQDNPMLEQLKKDLMYKKFAENDPGLADATMQMLVMAQGPKAFSYLFPELTATGRVANTIREKDASRLLGVPRKSDLKNFINSAASRDKVMWTLTGNAVKGAGVSDRAEMDEQH